jgi:hypothetical protein
MQSFNFDCTDLKVQIESGSTWGDRLTLNIEADVTLPRSIRPSESEPSEQVRWVLTLEEAKPAYSPESILTVGKAQRIKHSGAQVTTYLAQIYLNPTQLTRVFELVVSGLNPASIELSIDGLAREGFDEVVWGTEGSQEKPILDFGFTWSKAIPASADAADA